MKQHYFLRHFQPQLAKEQGLINHIGVSTFQKSNFKCLNYADISYVQAPMNILIKNRNKTLRQFCAEQNIKFVSTTRSLAVYYLANIMAVSNFQNDR